jgi:PhnB protein
MSISPQLSVSHGREAIAFYEAAFGAVVEHRVGGTDEHPDVVAQMSIDGATFWVADEAPEHGNFSPASLGGATVRLLLIAEDPVAVAGQAVAAGATLISQVHEQHGWSLGRIEDPYGHHWEIGRPLVPWPPPGGG